MAKRLAKAQSEHDLVIEKSADTYKAEGHEVFTNPGNEKNHSINDFYPDIIVKKRDGMIVIEEIETEDTVTQDECDRQWKPYLKLGYTFKLVVPASKVSLARRFIRDLDIELQSYRIIDDIVQFNLNP